MSDLSLNGHAVHTPALTLPSVPTNLEAEQALLAAILANNSRIDYVGPLEAWHFGDALHRRIYEAILAQLALGHSADAVTLQSYFDGEEIEPGTGTKQYLCELQGAYVNILADGIRSYATEVVQLGKRREAMLVFLAGIESLSQISLPSTDPQAEIDSIVAELDGQLEGPRDVGPQAIAMGLVEAVDRAEAVYRNKGALLGLTTGLESLDRAVGGFEAPFLYLLAARPGHFKTGLALQMARAAAQSSGLPVAIFSLEMSRRDLSARLLAAETGLSTTQQRQGPLSEADVACLLEAETRLKQLPLWIDDSAGLTIDSLRLRCRRLQRRRGLALVVVDYLQLMNGERPGNRVEEVSRISRGLKTLAMDLKVPVLALSQLSRAVEQRDDKRPLNSDLRESGALEQDADFILFNYWEYKYLQRQEPQKKPGESDIDLATRVDEWRHKMAAAKDRFEVITGKNRHGPESTLTLIVDPARMLFRDEAKGADLFEERDT